jgi:hypothetical protein
MHSHPCSTDAAGVDAVTRQCQNRRDLILTMEHGGRRPGSGPKTAFPRKDLDRAFGMDFTPEGRRQLEALQRREALSRSDILAHLILTYADRLRFEAPGVAFPGKAGVNVMKIRLPKAVGRILRAAQRRTGKGYSDIGEALVTRYGETAVFPILPGKEPPAGKRTRRRRRHG